MMVRERFKRHFVQALALFAGRAAKGLVQEIRHIESESSVQHISQNDI
jgi:hypothetical protein